MGRALKGQNNGRNPANKNAGIRAGGDLHLCELLLAEIGTLQAALKPFSDISDLVNHTEKRDGERVYELPKPGGGYFTLVRDDFRRAGKAFRSIPSTQRQNGE